MPAVSTNREISQVFRQIATALELLEANRFRIAGNQRVARVLADLTEEVDKIVKENPRMAIGRLTTIDGIGKASAQRIVERRPRTELVHQHLAGGRPPRLAQVKTLAPGLNRRWRRPRCR